ncbi:TRAP transporter small permease [Alphaproteobacteria bacterium]|nr:TRAP transporter small permease [Alphaproteobacteria bacterium]
MNSRNKSNMPLEKITTFFAWIAGALILFAAVLVTLDILAREIFSDNLFESYEISIYIFAITVAFSYAYALTTKTHIRIDALYVHLPYLFRVVLDIFSCAVISMVAVGLCYYGWLTALESFSFPTNDIWGARSVSDLYVPLVIPQSLWALGLTWFALTSLLFLFKSIFFFLKKDYQSVSYLIGIQKREEGDELTEALELTKNEKL